MEENTCGYSVKAIRKKFHDRGVFYTDRKLAEIMKGYIDITYDSVYDPTCGNGALLSVFGDDILKVGQEIDPVQAEAARKSLVNCIIYEGDTLTNPQGTDRRYDVCIANPPFSIAWNPVCDGRFGAAGALPPKSRADYAFILHCLYMINDGGMAIVLCFPGVLYRGHTEGVIRRWLVENGHIERVVRIPKGHFIDTNIETVLLVLRKKPVTGGIIFNDIIIGKERKVEYKEIADNDYCLCVERYVWEDIAKEKVDIMALQRDARKEMLKGLEKDIIADMLVCEIEGWNPENYFDEIYNMLDRLKMNIKKIK